MITQIKSILNTENMPEEMVSAELAYRLYAGYLKELPGEYVEKLHKNGVTPISQFLAREDGKWVWTVNLLGKETEETVGTVILKKEFYQVPQEIRVETKSVDRVKDVETLFAMASVSPKHRLEFATATAFKSQGQYTNLPTLGLCINNLVRQWNASFPETVIEDEDQEGIEQIINGLFCPKYRIRDCRYTLKGTCICGFRGEMTIKNNLKGFQKELADMLLLFSQYSGIGIKTTLGMGGVNHSFV